MSFSRRPLLPWLSFIDARPTGAHYARVNAGAVGGLRSPDPLLTKQPLFLTELQQRNTPAGVKSGRYKIVCRFSRRSYRPDAPASDPCGRRMKNGEKHAREQAADLSVPLFFHDTVYITKAVSTVPSFANIFRSSPVHLQCRRKTPRGICKSLSGKRRWCTVLHKAFSCRICN